MRSRWRSTTRTTWGETSTEASPTWLSSSSARHCASIPTPHRPPISFCARRPHHPAVGCTACAASGPRAARCARSSGCPHLACGIWRLHPAAKATDTQPAYALQPRSLREVLMYKSFAVITGASSGIGLELARCCADHGYDLLIAADQPAIHTVADELREKGRAVEAVQVDLSSLEGVEQLYAAAQGRPIDALLANAGHGLGKAFLDQETSA